MRDRPRSPRAGGLAEQVVALGDDRGAAGRRDPHAPAASGKAGRAVQLVRRGRGQRASRWRSATRCAAGPVTRSPRQRRDVADPTARPARRPGPGAPGRRRGRRGRPYRLWICGPASGHILRSSAASSCRAASASTRSGSGRAVASGCGLADGPDADLGGSRRRPACPRPAGRAWRSCPAVMRAGRRAWLRSVSAGSPRAYPGSAVARVSRRARRIASPAGRPARVPGRVDEVSTVAARRRGQPGWSGRRPRREREFRARLIRCAIVASGT